MSQLQMVILGLVVAPLAVACGFLGVQAWRRGAQLLDLRRRLDQEQERQARFDSILARLERLNRDLVLENEAVTASRESMAQEVKKRDLLLDLSQSFSSTLDLDTVLGTMLRKVREILLFHSGGVFLYNQDRTELSVAVTEGLYAEEMASQLSSDVGLPAMVAQTGRPLLFRETGGDPRFTDIRRTTRVHSAIYYPMVLDSEVHGVLCIWNMQPDAWSERDFELLTSVTSEAARAIKNAGLYREMDARLHFITTLWETSRNLTSSVDIASREWDKVLSEVLDSIRNLFESERALFLRYDKETRRLGPAIAQGISEQGGRRLAEGLNTSPLGLPFFLRSPFQVREVAKDRRLDSLAPTLASEQMTSILWAPLMGRQMTIGALVLATSSPRTWTQMQLQWVDIFAKMFSMTLENIFLFHDLASEKSQLQVLIDSMPEGVYTTDTAGRVLTWNAAAQSITGWSASQVTGHPCSEFIRCHTVERAICETQCPLRQALTAQVKVDTGLESVALARADGETEVPVFITAAPVHGDEGRLAGSIVVFRDITKEKQIEQMKEDFLATITHDLKSPLASVMGYTDLLLNPRLGEISTTQREFLEAIQRSSQTLQFLIDNILEITRMEAGQMQFNPGLFNLEALLSEIHEMFRPLAAPKSLRLDFFVDEKLIVYGDRDKMKEVFINLYANAIKFTRDQGVITTRVASGDARAWIQVSDTGKGIAADQIERLFKKFAQVKSDERRGTGLGLYIVKRVLQAHGEDIQVESQLGVGTTFSFALPRFRPEVSGGGVGGAWILIADRDRRASEALRAALEAEGWSALQVHTSEEALLAVQERKPQVLVVDARLPDLCSSLLGPLQELARAKGPRPRILALCDRPEQIPADVDSHLLRPVEARDVISTVHALIQMK